MPEPTVETTTTGVPAPAAGEGGQPAAPPAASAEPGGQPSATPPADDLNLSDREKAFLAKARDEVDKRQQIEQELALLRANAPQHYQQPSAAPSATPAAPAAPHDPLADLDDDDLLTGKDIKAKVMPMVMGMVQQIAGALAVQQRQSQFADVTNDDIRSHIPKMIQEDPALAQILKALPAPAQFIVAQTLTRFAKKAAMGAATAIPPGAPGPSVTSTGPAADPLSDLARQILANVQKPAAPGSGGGGAMDDVLSVLKRMTPEQYETYRAEKRKAMGL